MNYITDNTPKLKSDNCESKADHIAGEALAAAAYDDYCRKFMTAEQTNRLEDAEVTGYARARFLWHFDRLPGVSAGGAS